jgi:hypothetical protein
MSDHSTSQSYNKTRIGEIRPSQLLWTFGPGALIDLPNMSVVTLSTDRWPIDSCVTVHENRLLRSVQQALGPSVQSLRMPPPIDAERDNPDDAQAFVGVPVRPFPRWMRCVQCGLLSPIDSGLFSLKENNFRPERTQYVHKGCTGSDGKKRPKDADAVPARFLLACPDGHLDDFPWRWFVHNGPTECTGTLRFFEGGGSLQTEDLYVRCDGCVRSRPMAQAFGEMGARSLPRCRGRHPHLDDFEPNCDQTPRAILLGASNGWFPITLSALAIPSTADPLGQIVSDGWVEFEDIEDEAELRGVVKSLRKNGRFPGIEKYDVSKIWEAIKAHRDGTFVEQSDLKSPEWDIFTDPNPPKDFPHFMSETADVPRGYEKVIDRVLLLTKLREVNALLGFTRIDAPENGSVSASDHRAPLSRPDPDFVPASEVHGEGIFIQFNNKALDDWSNLEAVKERDAKLFNAHKGWRSKRKLEPPELAYPGARYILLHTLAHMLIRELALQCGYGAASIRERIYADVEGEQNQAGVLIYTAAADSDGTLGGLVELGKPENFGPIIEKALDRAMVCASDPLCSEHDPTKDQSLHGAACHACALVSETSCESGNRYLDRALLVPTLETSSAAFFLGS